MNFTVLIADDEAMPRNVLQNYIPWEELSVARVYLASDGVEAVEQARRYRPELIISDIKMPYLNGLEMAAAVREFLPAFRLFRQRIPQGRHPVKSSKLCGKASESGGDYGCGQGDYRTAAQPGKAYGRGDFFPGRAFSGQAFKSGGVPGRI